MKMDLIIKNGLVCTESGIIKGGLGIRDGVIQYIGSDHTLPEGEREYDAQGNIVFPGVIEAHSHLGLDGLSEERYLADMETETKAAAQGGVTTVNTTTLFGSESLREKFDIAMKGLDRLFTDINFYVAPGNEEHLEEIPTLFEEGVSAFKFLLGYRGEGAKVFGMDESGLDTGFMFKAFRKVAEQGSPAFAMIHAEDPLLFEITTAEWMDKEHRNLIEAFHHARPSVCEVVDAAKGGYIADETGCPLYIVHISAKETLDLLRHMQDQGYDVTGETCLHYLMYNCTDPVFEDEDLAKFAKVNPPIREKADQEALWKALKSGLIEVVGTDHVNYVRGTKLDPGFWETTAGCGDGLSVLLPLMYSEGVNKGRIDLDTLRRILCEKPAKVYGLYPQKGTLAVGSDADVVVIDPAKTMTIDYRDSESTNEFSIYQDWEVKGVPVATFVRGNLVAENYKIVGHDPKGKYLKDKVKVRL